MIQAQLLSVALILALFIKAWLVALRNSLTTCSSIETCPPQTVLYNTVVAIAGGWMLMFVILFVMWVVEVVIIGVLSQPILSKSYFDPNSLKLSVGLRVVLHSWLNWRLWVAIMLSMVATLVLSTVILKVLQWHMEDARTPPENKRLYVQRAVVSIYIFQLFSLIAFILYQFRLSYATTCKDHRCTWTVRKCR